MTNIKYNLSKPTPPAMPRLGKGTESVQLLLSQVSKDMHQPIVPILFPILGAHVSGAEFMFFAEKRTHKKAKNSEIEHLF